MPENNHSLELLPQRHGFRLRGTQMTRIETFSDAAFAFALTLLVISIDSIPTNVATLVDLMRGVPAFLISFALLMWFWNGHHIWSKRYGLDDTPTIWLSSALVLCILVFVYPLKFLHMLIVARLSDGALATSLEPLTRQELQHTFVTYGICFTVTSLILMCHYWYAWSQRAQLSFSHRELLMTRHSIIEWGIPTLVGATSITIALLAPLGNGWPGMIYISLAVLMPAFGYLSGRQLSRLSPSIPVTPALDDPFSLDNNDA